MCFEFFSFKKIRPCFGVLSYSQKEGLLSLLCFFFSICFAEIEDKVLAARSWEILNIKLKELGFDIGHFAPGVENRMLCPKVFSLLSSFKSNLLSLFYLIDIYLFLGSKLIMHV